MNITSTGDRLNFLITCNHSVHHDWMSFASWYSIYRNLPEAEVSLFCARTTQGNYAAYNWPYRCDIQFFQHQNIGNRMGFPQLNKLYAIYSAIKEGVVRQPLLVVDYDVMALRDFSKETLSQLNDSGLKFGISGPIWYFQDQPCERFAQALNTFKDYKDENEDQRLISMISSAMGKPEFVNGLYCSCTDLEPTSFVGYGCGCGKFSKEKWLKERLNDPFRYTAKLHKNGMTINEQQVFNLWSKMHVIYDAVR